MRIKIASRKSDLAQVQAVKVGDSLKTKFPELVLEYSFYESLGDKNLNDPLWKMPEKGVFTEDFYRGLVEKEWDLVVHSWKDLPLEERAETEIACTLARADSRDIFLLRKKSWEKVKQTKQISILSSSPRRAYNIPRFLPRLLPCELEQVDFVDVRGNVPTRMRKLLEQEQDALILAKAGLDRLLESDRECSEQLGEILAECYWMILPLSVNPTAAAQGALAIEVLSERNDLKEMLRAIHCDNTFAAVTEERKILQGFGGGCHQKIGVSVLKRDYGRFISIQGKTEMNTDLDSLSIENYSRKVPVAKASEVWPLHLQEVKWFKRKNLASLRYEESAAYWVARANAWPGYWPQSIEPQQNFLWASGVNTWTKLASMGLWVHGSVDGLGEQEQTNLSNSNLSNLVGYEPKWQKLSHDQAPDKGVLPLKATYSLSPTADYPDLKNKTHFFWTSGSGFDRAIELYPEICDKYHACGPGNTYAHIAERLGASAKLYVFLDHQEWLKAVLEE